MQDIADRAGVTRATVSMALRNHRRIGEATRLRVQGIALHLGYRPNPMISALMSNLRMTRSNSQSPSIAVIISRDWDKWRLSPLALKLDKGITEQAALLGYAVEYISLKDLNSNEARLSQILYARGIQGLIITSFLSPTDSLDLEWKHFGAVMLDYSVLDPVLHRVCSHHFHTITLTMKKVLERGYRRIGLAIQRDVNTRIDRSWEAGFLLFQQSVPAKFRIPPLISPAHNERGFLKWFHSTTPEVVISDSLEIFGWMKSLPADSTDFVHLQWTEESGECAGIDPNFDLVGAAAVDALADMFNRNERGIPLHPKTIMVEGTWKEGRTLRRPLRS
jgi:DNA-binding LacI/PurR family transcriptional regulator